MCYGQSTHCPNSDLTSHAWGQGGQIATNEDLHNQVLELCGSDSTALHRVLLMAHHSTAFIQEVAKNQSVAGETIVVIPCPTRVIVSEHGLHELCSGDLMELGPYTQVNLSPTC